MSEVEENLDEMRLIQVTSYEELELKPEQDKQISSIGRIQDALKLKECLGYEAYLGEEKIGFALLREFEQRRFFLWNFIIARKHQGQGYGKMFLEKLIKVMRDDLRATTLTTTYTFSNEVARKLYDSCGFEETDVVLEGSTKEVNMVLLIQSGWNHREVQT